MSLVKVIGAVQPDEIYNLAAQSHVQVSFDSPEFTANVDATGIQHSVREFAYYAFKHAGIELKFEGKGLNQYSSLEKRVESSLKKPQGGLPIYFHCG